MVRREGVVAAIGIGRLAANFDLEEDSTDGHTAATPQLINVLDAISVTVESSV